MRKTYGARQILDGVSFAVEPGTACAIIGKNGCGKSTLLAVAASVLRPDSGRVLLGGKDPADQPELRKFLGYLAQGDSLFEELTVGENLRFWGSAAGLHGSGVTDNPFVELLGLNDFWQKRVSRLSGGMRRRTAICAALLGDPEYILLDEPFSGLDMLYRQELSAFLRKMCEMGKTIIYTTHSPEELADLGDTALLLQSGRILREENISAHLSGGANLQALFLSYLKGEDC
ncbi:MAG: ABC transporter ATP-binding protein [Oscillospiraceae bacterium]|nr:ABC transporter ATP-binding protein [Oscillospiraceae bacterium]